MMLVYIILKNLGFQENLCKAFADDKKAA